MASQFEIGSYNLILENNRLRLERRGTGMGMPIATPFLQFVLTEAGVAPIPFSIQRVHPIGVGVVDIHGYTTDRVALDGRLSYDPHTDSVLCVVRIENATNQMEMRLSAQLLLNGEADPRWLVPGFFYADNRPRGNTRFYPSFSELAPDARRMVSSWWAVRSDRAAMPLACVWTYRAFAYMASEGVFGRNHEEPSGIGMTGLHFGIEDGVPTVGVEFPYREQPVKFSFCQDDRIEPEETYILLPENTPLEISCRLGFGAPDLHSYARVLKGLYESSEQDDHSQPMMAPDQAEHIAHIGLLKWHFDGRAQAIYENATFDRHFGKKGTYLERSHMHSGWLSGILPAFTLLWAGRETNHADSVAAGMAVLNKFCSKLAPCGTIFPVWTEEHGWSCSFGPEQGTAHSRTVAEGVYFLIRSLALEMSYEGRHREWMDAIHSSLNYAMGAQREDGCFPAYYELTIGRVGSYEGTAGIAWMAAFALGSVFFQRSHYYEVARRAGDYYARFVKTGFLFGSVEDQPLTPSSDDCHWALIGYMALYEVDRDQKWLDLARRAADLSMTWRVGYNIDFEPVSMLGAYGFRTCGGDISTVATPVLTCNGLVIYRELLKLSAYTGDAYYRRRAEDSRNFAQQLIVTQDGQYNGRMGMVAGQVFHTDWWQPKGVMLSLSYAISASLVKYAELVRRSMVLSQETVDWARSVSSEEMRLEPVLYLPTETPALPPAAAAAGMGSAALSPTLDAGLSSRTSAEVASFGSDAIAGSLARILSMKQEADKAASPPAASARSSRDAQPIPSLDPRAQGMRGFSTDQVPLAGFRTNEPVPFPEQPNRPIAPPSLGSPNDTSDGSPEDDDAQIKYKIF